MLAAILVPLLFVAIAVAIVLGYRSLRARNVAEMTQLRALPGPQHVPWQPQPPDQRYLHQFGGGPLWQVDHGRGLGRHRIEQVITTRYLGYEAVAFSYVCEERGVHMTPQGRSRRHQYSVVSVRLPRAFPSCQITPARTDPRAEQVLGPEAQRQRATDPRSRTFPLLVEGTTINSWYHNYVFVDVHALAAEVVDPMLDYLVEIAHRLPR